MEASEQHESTPEEPAADPTSERSPEATEGSPSESTQESGGDASSQSDQTDESAEPSAEAESSAPADSPSEPSSEAADQAEADAAPAESEDPGLLAGTSSEQQPGVGGTGDHPAPAAMRDESGALHSAGRPPSGTVESEESPTGDATDLTDAGHAQSPEAREELDSVHEPDQVETDRPDLGTT